MTAALRPLAVFGMWLGVGFHGRIEQQTFYRICYAMLPVVGVKLLLDGLGLAADRRPGVPLAAISL